MGPSEKKDAGLLELEVERQNPAGINAPTLEAAPEERVLTDTETSRGRSFPNE